MKKSEQVVQSLLAKGCRELPSPSRKYRKFTHPRGPDIFYFIGKAGALRAGKNASSSISLTSHFAGSR